MPNENKIRFIGFVGLTLLMLALLGRTYRGFERPPAAAILGTEAHWEPSRWSNNNFPAVEQPTILKADKALPLVPGETIESPLPEPLVQLIDTHAYQADSTALHPEKDRQRRPFMPLGFWRDDLPLVPPEMPIPQP